MKTNECVHCVFSCGPVSECECVCTLVSPQYCSYRTDLPSQWAHVPWLVGHFLLGADLDRELVHVKGDRLLIQCVQTKQTKC